LGAKISELSGESTVQTAMQLGDCDLEDYIEQLRETLLRWSQSKPQRDGGADEQNDLDD
jgi:hypothetical protein